MADTARTSNRLTVREFLEWEDRQPTKHELHNGLIRMMAGGTLRHNTTKGNIFAALRGKLRGGPCRPFDSDTRVRAEGGGVFYPDVVVNCGPADGSATEAQNPVVVFEVLSKSTRDSDFAVKLRDYQATPAIRQIVYVEPDLMHLMVWRRTDNGWVESEVVRPEHPLVLDALGVELSFAEIYEDVDFAR